MPRKRKGPPGLRGRPTKWNPAANLKHPPKTIVTHKKKLTQVSSREPNLSPVLPQINKEIEIDSPNKMTTLKTWNESKMERELSRLNTIERKRSPAKEEKNSFGNRLVHVESLRNNIESCAACKLCGGDLKLEESTIGIATTLELQCKKCNINKKTAIFHSQCDVNSKKYKAVDSFAINCLFVIALHKIGGGATESSVLLTYLGLPCAQTFQKSHFKRIETKIRPWIKN